MHDDARPGIEFEPVRIGARRRRLDPLRIGAIVIIGGLLVAVVKPWDLVTNGSAAQRSTSPSTGPTGLGSGVPGALPSTSGLGLGGASGSSPPTAVPSAPTDAPAASDVAAVDVLAAVAPHDGWGVSAITEGPTPGRLSESWAPADAGDPATHLVGFRSAYPVVAISITTPDGLAPLDVRIHRAVRDGTWAWVDAPPLASDRLDAGFVFRPPSVDGVRPSAWPSGSYRFDVLTGTSIEQVELHLADGQGDAGPDLPAPVRTGGGAPAPILTAVLPVGPFVVTDGVARHLDAAPIPGDRTAVDAWLDLPAGTDPVDPPEPADPALTQRSGHASAIGVTDVGLALPDGASSISLLVDRLSPDPWDVALSYDVIADADRSDTPPYLVIDPPFGDTWAAGVYMIHAGWVDRTGRQTRHWQVELEPGPLTDAPPYLAAARAFAPYAGKDGLVEGPRAAVAGETGAGAIRLFPFDAPPAPGASIPAIGCGDQFIDGRPRVIGIVRSSGPPPVAVAADIRFPDGRRQVLPLRTSTFRGLTIVGPATGIGFAPGVYDFSWSADGQPARVTVCLGTSPFEG